MPHVVIAGPVSVERVHREIGPFEERHGDAVLKVRECYLARSGRAVLLEAIVVEGATRRFLVAVEGHPDSLTVRLFPMTDPEKTAGVKRLVARIASRVCGLDREARVIRTNLAGELGELEAEAGR